jgi:hypothetical protein
MMLVVGSKQLLGRTHDSRRQHRTVKDRRTDSSTKRAPIAEQPRLVLTRSWMKPTTPCPTEEFRTEAFQAAVGKARELKWIA